MAKTSRNIKEFIDENEDSFISFVQVNKSFEDNHEETSNDIQYKNQEQYFQKLSLAFYKKEINK